MDNKEIYKKTLTFSLRRLAWDMMSFIVIIIAGAAGFFLAEKLASAGLVGLAIGVIIGIVAVAIASHFVSYVFKAGQIAMMTRGITDGKLPDDVYAEGKQIVKERFLTVAAYYAVTKLIGTRYFSDDDADVVECDCYECEPEEETAEEAAE